MGLKLHLGHQILFQVGCIGKSFHETFNIPKLLFFIEEKMQVGAFQLLEVQVIPVPIERQNQFMSFLLYQSPQQQRMLD